MRGDLTKDSLPDVLRRIYMERRSGSLRLVQDHTRKEIFFELGAMVFASSNRREDRIGETMLRHGTLSRSDFEIVQSHMGRGKRFGKVLIDLRLLSERELITNVTFQVLDIIYSVFNWTSGNYEFIEIEKSISDDLKLELSTASIILEGVRRIDELAVIERGLGDLNRLVGPAVNPLLRLQTLSLKPLERQIIDLAREPISLFRLLVSMKASAEATLRALYGLLCAGVLERFAPPELGRSGKLIVPEVVRQAVEEPIPIVTTARNTGSNKIDEMALRRRIEVMKARMEQGNHYDILEATAEMNREELHNAYYKLAREFHPDRHLNANKELRNEIDEIFSQLTLSYETVRNATQMLNASSSPRRAITTQVPIRRLNTTKFNAEEQFAEFVEPRKTGPAPQVSASQMPAAIPVPPQYAAPLSPPPMPPLPPVQASGVLPPPPLPPIPQLPLPDSLVELFTPPPDLLIPIPSGTAPLDSTAIASASFSRSASEKIGDILANESEKVARKDQEEEELEETLTPEAYQARITGTAELHQQSAYTAENYAVNSTGDSQLLQSYTSDSYTSDSYASDNYPSATYVSDAYASEGYNSETILDPLDLAAALADESGTESTSRPVNTDTMRDEEAMPTLRDGESGSLKGLLDSASILALSDQFDALLIAPPPEKNYSFEPASTIPLPPPPPDISAPLDLKTASEYSFPNNTAFTNDTTEMPLDLDLPPLPPLPTLPPPPKRLNRPTKQTLRPTFDKTSAPLPVIKEEPEVIPNRPTTKTHALTEPTATHILPEMPEEPSLSPEVVSKTAPHPALKPPPMPPLPPTPSIVSKAEPRHEPKPVSIIDQIMDRPMETQQMIAPSKKQSPPPPIEMPPMEVAETAAMPIPPAISLSATPVAEPAVMPAFAPERTAEHSSEPISEPTAEHSSEEVLEDDAIDARVHEQAERLFVDGRSRFQTKDLNGAVKALKEAVNLDPKQIRYRLLLGHVMSNHQRWHKQAEEQFRKVLELDAYNAMAYVGLGQLYTKVGLNRRAENEFREALKLDPENIVAQKGLQSLQREEPPPQSTGFLSKFFKK